MTDELKFIRMANFINDRYKSANDIFKAEMLLKLATKEVKNE